MIEKRVRVSVKRDAGKCSAEAAQLVTVTIVHLKMKIVFNYLP